VEPSPEVGGYTSTINERRDKKMKYIVFWEFCPEDLDKVLERVQAFGKDGEKHPDKYPKVIFSSHSMAGETKGFEIVEATLEQMTEDITFFIGYVTLKFVPILDTVKIVESYLKSK
jgi:hypothetical protein